MQSFYFGCPRTEVDSSPHPSSHGFGKSDRQHEIRRSSDGSDWPDLQVSADLADFSATDMAVGLASHSFGDFSAPNRNLGQRQEMTPEFGINMQSSTAPVVQPYSSGERCFQGARQIDAFRIPDSGGKDNAPAVVDAWAAYTGRPGAGPTGTPVIGSSVVAQITSRSTAMMIPAMTREAVGAVVFPGLEGLYLDASFGRGAYTTELLRRLTGSRSTIVAFSDERNQSVTSGAKEFKGSDSRLEAILQRSIGDVGTALAGRELAGAIVDLGTAFHQSGEEVSRALSLPSEVLDLRVGNASCAPPASEWIQSASIEELAWVIHGYGEDDDPLGALRIAESIKEFQRLYGPLRTVAQLTEAVRKVKTAGDERNMHPAKLTFQALRTFINGEMEKLSAFLEEVMSLMRPGARLVVVSTRRSEASQVKSFVRRNEDCHPLFSSCSAGRLQELYPLFQTNQAWAVRQACDPIWPSVETSTSGSGGRRPARSLAAHVLERANRVTRNALRGGANVQFEAVCARPHEKLFRKPSSPPFFGSQR